MVLDYLKKFADSKDLYSIMKWENLIIYPDNAGKMIAKRNGRKISARDAGNLVNKMSNRNQTPCDKFNFRKWLIGD
jgi:hypothetical protein